MPARVHYTTRPSGRYLNIHRRYLGLNSIDRLNLRMMENDVRSLLTIYHQLIIRDIQFPSLRLLLRSLMMHIAVEHDAILEVPPELNESIPRTLSLGRK